MSKLCFIDTETTSLDDRTGEIWEVGLIVRYASPGTTDITSLDTEYLWQLPVEHLERADPISLNIGKFHERRWPTLNPETDYTKHLSGTIQDSNRIINAIDMPSWSKRFVELTRDAHFIANVPSFDELRLCKLLRRWGQCPMWHYHLICVENLITGRLGIHPPWKSKDLSEAIGVPVPEDQHGALPDARWARDMFDAVFECAKGEAFFKKAFTTEEK